LKRIASIIVVVVLIVAALAAWRLLGSNTGFTENKKNFYIKTGSSFNTVMNELVEENIIKNPGTFEWAAKQLDYNSRVKAGKYVIEKGASIITIVRMLRSGKQTPVNLVINKLRTREDLAKKVAASFECDSIAFINLITNMDTLRKLGLDTNTVMTIVIPNTYTFFWNTPPYRIFKKLYEEKEKFWNDQRKAQAHGLNLTTAEVYTLASIVEEETNSAEDKGKVASVYLNRLETGMRLAADPTVKFAMKDFGLKRIYFKHLKYPSPYNTYLNAGLPPGPICTPSTKTIDAVLEAPSTSYLFFVAKPDLRGGSNFATNYQDHQRYAKAYQRALDSMIIARQQR